jgi:PAS domain S-box-containing protein
MRDARERERPEPAPPHAEAADGERARLQEALRESEAGLKRAQALARLAHVVTGADGGFESWSETLPSLVGCEPEAMPRSTRAWLELVHPVDRARFRATAVQARASQARAEVDYRLRRSDGAWIHVRQVMEPIGTDAAGEGRWFSTLQDLTEHRRVEHRLSEVESQFQFLFRNNPLPMWVYDRASLRFLEVNEAAVARYGYRREEFLAMRILDIRPPEEVERLQANLRENSAVVQHSGPWTHRLRDGSLVQVEVASHLVDWNGTGAALVVAADVTERLRAQSEVARMNRELEARVAERTAQLVDANRELEAFSYSVSHDLRAPLRHVQGFIEMLVEACAAGQVDKVQRHAAIIAAAANDMGTLIDDLLAFSQTARSEVRRARVDMDALVAEAIRALDSQCRDRRVEWRVAPLPAVEGDLGLLRQVLANLLGNAVKYTRGRDPAIIEVGAADDGQGGCEFHVRDNGVGFDMAHAARLFGVFQRLHRADEFEGTGIGLAIAHRVIARHGGRIRAEAAPGAGAAFLFTVPPAAAGD